MDVSETIKQIKRGFRLYMNGVTSHSMREKGVNYKINWGVSQVDIRTIAQQYEPNTRLATELWMEDIRECKLLATYLMPKDAMTLEMALEWGSGISSVEIAEASVFNLFRHLSFAEELVRLWLRDNDYRHIAAYHLLCRLIKQNTLILDETFDILWKFAKNDIKTNNIALRHALLNCLSCIASTSTKHSVNALDILSMSDYSAF